MHSLKRTFSSSSLLLLAITLGVGALQSVNAQPGRFERELGCVTGDCENGRGTLIEETERGRVSYRGTFKNSEYDGFGRLEYEDEKAVYKGYFKAGKRQGRGTYWDSDNSVYIGQWRNDRRNGHGTQAFNVDSWTEDAHTEQWLENNTENYTGNFSNDVFYGEGTYRWENGTLYVGNWVANKRHGEGYYDYGDGRIANRRYEYGERIVEFGF